ncbi:MAG: DUF1579 domain-containing protein [Ignavibacteriaceae bacterium]|nr:DUF1579 domain-containing protein [Ignavibacteria bacterium]NNJ52896.1 DUF1579 domain-containing protein [Ignavibacteriaceae bacterium]NNL19929.1 DUF1579 domain-containing protein [Ignavibacteriaceae bacterium]
MLKYFFIIYFAALLFSSLTLAQDEMSQNEQMNKWMEYMTPGSTHEMLANSVGEWKTVSKWWMDPSSDEPMQSEGSATFEMILGGRYQKSSHSSEVMGMPMEGINLLGYDNATQEFTSVWIDNMGTGTAVAKGKYDEDSNSIIMNGFMVDPMTEREMTFKQVYIKIDDDRQIVEMYMDFDGEEFKSMEVEMIRQ